jgi:1-acyl-sn-glycerol-3-phosphate acyltransferase
VADSSQFGLLAQRRFAPFFATQFLGALNDNVYKNALVLMVAFHGAALTSMSSDVVVNLAGALFMLPFFLFSATAGQLADKYDKARLIRIIKLLEIGIMMLGAAGFVVSSLPLLLAALFLMGLHSTLFGPVKYAILPQTLDSHEIVGGNALVETGTSLAILAGTIAGGLLIAADRGAVLWVPAAVIGIAIAGYLTARRVPSAPPPAPDLRIDWNPLTETWRNLKFARGNRTVFLSILGVSWFWLYGLVFISQFPNYARVNLGGTEHVVTLLLTMFSIGIGVGSLLCERMSGHKVELGLVPFGSIGLTVFAFDLAFASPGAHAGPALGAWEFLAAPGSFRVLFDLAMIGLFGGFYIVPLYALIQSRSERAHQSRIIAGNNIVNALFMVVGAGLSALLLSRGLTIPQLFLVTALMNAAVAAFIYTLVPEFLMRFLAWMLVHTLYRVEQEGLEHVPDEGAAVVVCNHVSFIDAVVIMGVCRRPVRFVMDHQIFKVPVLNFVFRTGRCIPIAGRREDPALMEKAFADVREGLAAGDLIGIFPEGRITDTGELHTFRPGISRILEESPVPVIPMALRGLWGSFFSRKDGPAMTRPFRRGLFNRIALVTGAPVAPADASPEALQARVLTLRGDWR